ncbi:MAG: sigma-70 family RNA polymerase sigma factor [Verrucomicrobiota bacterium]
MKGRPVKRDLEDVGDEWLVLRSQEGSAGALEALLRRWQERLWLYAVRLTGDEDAARDVTQEALIAIARGIRRLRDPARFRAWAYRIVGNRSRDWVRGRVRRRRLAAESEEAAALRRAEAGGGEPGALVRLREGLERLPEGERELLRLHYQAGLSVVEIAEVEGIPAGTVKSRLYRAREHLKAIVGADEPVS